MTPIDALFEWLEATPGYLGAYINVRGVWRAQAGDEQERFAVMMMMPGGQYNGLLHGGNVRLVLLGKERDNDVLSLEQMALDIRTRLEEDFTACGIVQIMLTGGIIGPGRTEEGRPWYELNFSILST